jgi:predicted kinase/histidinol phosphatase-like enzyme
VALAWLLDLNACVVPLPGATRIAHAASLARVRTVRFTDADRDRLDVRFPAGRLLRVPRSVRRSALAMEGEVVLVMGMPGAGKSTVADSLARQGYTRLNRDERGGRLADLVKALDQGLASGVRHWVLDNTYASRRSRNEIIECAWRHRARVRCAWLDTPIADAQINAIRRLLDAHGKLPTPQELHSSGKRDHRYFGPDAQFRYERALEPPTLEEGFERVDTVPFERRFDRSDGRRALILEYDGVLAASRRGAPAALDADDVHLPGTRRDVLRSYHENGWVLFGAAWRPQITTGATTEAAVQACFERTRELLGVELPIAFCPHPAGPPICWCRKPLPGLALAFLHANRLGTEGCLVVGGSAADRTMAGRLSMTCLDPATFFEP